MTSKPLDVADRLVPGDDGTNPLKGLVRARHDRHHGVAKRLEELYGVGERPTLRRKFYAAVQRVVVERGEPVFLLVRGLAASAAIKRSPDRWFICALKQRFLDEGIDLWDHKDVWD